MANDTGPALTEVQIKFTGEIWARMGSGHMHFAFEGSTLGDLLRAFFKQYNVRDLVLDANGAMRTRSRVTVNGRFADTLGHLNTPIHNGDVIVLMRPGLGAT